MNISLIGMPASGKTTIAKKLKELLPEYNLVDTDEKIVQNENRTINDIFKKDGEDFFRNIETSVLKDILLFDKQIISTGGGIIKKDENIELLKKYSTLIYLKADAETLTSRAKNSSERPLLNDCNVSEKIKLILQEREQKYKQAHIIIETEGKNPMQTALEIMDKINENNRCQN